MLKNLTRFEAIHLLMNHNGDSILDTPVEDNDEDDVYIPITGPRSSVHSSTNRKYRRLDDIVEDDEEE